MAAALRVTTPGGQILTYVLEIPLVLELVTGRRQTRYVSESLDKDAREVITIGEGRAEFAATLRFVRRPQDMIDLLSYAAAGATLTYYERVGGPGRDFSVLLTDELLELLQDPDRFGFGEYSARIRLRDASASGVSIESISSPWLWRHSAGSFRRHGTFTRAGTIGAYRDVDGLLKHAAANVLRQTWRSVNGVWRQYTLLEATRINKFLRSGELDNAAWGKSGLAGTPIIANQATGPDGTLALDKIVEDANNSAHFISQAVTGMQANGFYALSGWFLASERAWVELRLRETAATANFVQAWYDLENGVVGSAGVGGTGVFFGHYMEDWTWLFRGLYRCVLDGAVANGATAIDGLALLATGDEVSSYQGDGSSGLYGGYLQLENNARQASTYIPTTTAEDSRGSEVFSDIFPYTPAQLAEIGGATFYWDFIEGLTPNFTTDQARVGQVGASDNSAPRLVLHRNSGSDLYRWFHDTGTLVESTCDLVPNRGDRVQLAAQFHPDGSVQLLGRLNGETDDAGTRSAPNPPASAWSDDVIWLNGVGPTGNPGITEFSDVIVFEELLDVDACEERASA